MRAADGGDFDRLKVDEPAGRGGAACARRLGAAAELTASAAGLRGGAAFVDVVDDAPGLGLLGAHEVVAVEGALDLLVGAAAVLGVELVQPPLGLDDVLGVALDVRGLALRSRRRAGAP